MLDVAVIVPVPTKLTRLTLTVPELFRAIVIEVLLGVIVQGTGVGLGDGVGVGVGVGAGVGVDVGVGVGVGD